MWIFYPKRNGWRWEVWYSRADKQPDPANGATEWRALWGVSFLRWINAARTASDMAHAYLLGSVSCEDMPLDECP